MPKDKPKDTRGNLDGCSLHFTVASDEETQAVLIPKGEENPSWTEEEEKVKSNGA
jgi:hypothetical protein